MLFSITDTFFSAAHCIQDKDRDDTLLSRDVVVLLGAYDLNDPYDSGTLSQSPSQIIVHPHWNPHIERFDADLAIIIPESAIMFTSRIIPVCMLSPYHQDAGMKEGILIGWGQSEDKSKRYETIPRQLKTSITPNEECFLDNYEFAKIASNRTFCAGNKNGTGPCT